MFLANDTLFFNFHIESMVEALGRRLMPGDVLEIPHLKDFLKQFDLFQINKL